MRTVKLESVRVFPSDAWIAFWNDLESATVTFEDLGLRRYATTLYCGITRQREQIVLITSNRNADAPDSLETIIREVIDRIAFLFSRYPIPNGSSRFATLKERLLAFCRISCTLRGSLERDESSFRNQSSIPHPSIFILISTLARCPVKPSFVASTCTSGASCIRPSCVKFKMLPLRRKSLRDRPLAKRAVPLVGSTCEGPRHSRPGRRA